ncbi:hypothetical protein [Hyalangium rubrum]|uniref:Lipoprotein n=1 Tax=Hyalangium rubrum TaxID=3103134 RepID=A0ABU5HFU8_9BACT|nr:hypothetical protein [Hyalangium sp. s54d21]MDY7231734.1 hypothetical protein [Hyalangium sp. s54d21]
MTHSPPLRLALLSCLFLGCGLLDELPSRDARCDLRPAYDQCTDLREFKGPSFFTFEGVCETLRASTSGGSYREDARCDMTGVVGGCQTSHGDGSEQTNWYYSGDKYKTESDVREECDSGQEFTAPVP